MRIRPPLRLRPLVACMFAVIAVLAASAEEQANATVNIGLRKQLFVDDHVVATKSHVTREVGRATKYRVVLEPTLPTDFQAGVVHDGPDGGPGYEFGESTFCWFSLPIGMPTRINSGCGIGRLTG